MLSIKQVPFCDLTSLKLFKRLLVQNKNAFHSVEFYRFLLMLTTDIGVTGMSFCTIKPNRLKLQSPNLPQR